MATAPNIHFMKAIICFLSIAIGQFYLATETAALDDTVAVRIFESYCPKSVDVGAPFDLLGDSSRSRITVPCTAEAKNGRIWLRAKSSNANRHNETSIFAVLTRFCIQEVGHRGVCLSSNAANISNRRRTYHGALCLEINRGVSLDIINKVSKHDFVAGIVASELPKDAPYELLRAQAVLVQTLLSRRKTASLRGDSTNSQCYLGASLETALTDAAVASVWGENVYYNNLPIEVYYHSTCAGGTSNGAKYFSLRQGQIPYLIEVHCDFCKQSPFWQKTTKEIPKDLFKQTFGSELPKIIEKDYTNRPLLVRLANGKTLSGYNFWLKLGQNFGWDKAPGTRYNLRYAENGNVSVESTGAGHGIGLCQWGAFALAKEGKSYKEILRYYFPGCSIY